MLICSVFLVLHFRTGTITKYYLLNFYDIHRVAHTWGFFHVGETDHTHRQKRHCMRHPMRLNKVILDECCPAGIAEQNPGRVDWRETLTAAGRLGDQP